MPEWIPLRRDQKRQIMAHYVPSMLPSTQASLAVLWDLLHVLIPESLSERAYYVCTGVRALLIANRLGHDVSFHMMSDGDQSKGSTVSVDGMMAMVNHWLERPARSMADLMGLVKHTVCEHGQRYVDEYTRILALYADVTGYDDAAVLWPVDALCENDGLPKSVHTVDRMVDYVHHIVQSLSSFTATQCLNAGYHIVQANQNQWMQASESKNIWRRWATQYRYCYLKAQHDAAAIQGPQQLCAAEVVSTIERQMHAIMCDPGYHHPSRQALIEALKNDPLHQRLCQEFYIGQVLLLATPAHLDGQVLVDSMVHAYQRQVQSCIENLQKVAVDFSDALVDLLRRMPIQLGRSSIDDARVLAQYITVFRACIQASVPKDCMHELADRFMDEVIKNQRGMVLMRVSVQHLVGVFMYASLKKKYAFVYFFLTCSIQTYAMFMHVLGAISKESVDALTMFHVAFNKRYRAKRGISDQHVAYHVNTVIDDIPHAVAQVEAIAINATISPILKADIFMVLMLQHASVMRKWVDVTHVPQLPVIAMALQRIGLDASAMQQLCHAYDRCWLAGVFAAVAQPSVRANILPAIRPITEFDNELEPLVLFETLQRTLSSSIRYAIRSWVSAMVGAADDCIILLTRPGHLSEKALVQLMVADKWLGFVELSACAPSDRRNALAQRIVTHVLEAVHHPDRLMQLMPLHALAVPLSAAQIWMVSQWFTVLVGIPDRLVPILIRAAYSVSFSRGLAHYFMQETAVEFSDDLVMHCIQCIESSALSDGNKHLLQCAFFQTFTGGRSVVVDAMIRFFQGDAVAMPMAFVHTLYTEYDHRFFDVCIDYMTRHMALSESSQADIIDRIVEYLESDLGYVEPKSVPPPRVSLSDMLYQLRRAIQVKKIRSHAIDGAIRAIVKQMT